MVDWEWQTEAVMKGVKKSVGKPRAIKVVPIPPPRRGKISPKLIEQAVLKVRDRRTAEAGER